jgi:MIP family channel proteins
MPYGSVVKGLESKLRVENALFREFFAELIGTFLLVLIGNGSVAQVVLSNGTKGDFFTINFCYALAVGFGVMISGGVSGGHINPAVTLAMALAGKCAWIKVPVYWVAQYLGAFLASPVLYAVYKDALEDYTKGKYGIDTAGIWATFPQSYLSSGTALFDQIIGTFILLIVVMAVTDPRNMEVNKGMYPLYVGLTVGAIGMGFGYNCGFAINPARDLGPRIFTAIAGWGSAVFSAGNYFFWIPIVGPHIGAILGVIVYGITVGYHFSDDELLKQRT